MRSAALLAILVGLAACAPRPFHFRRPVSRRVTTTVRVAGQPGATEQRFDSGLRRPSPGGGGVDILGTWAPRALAPLSIGGCLGMTCGAEAELGYDQPLPGRFLPVGGFVFGTVRSAGGGLSGGLRLLGDARAGGALSFEMNVIASWARNGYEALEVRRSGMIEEPIDFPIAYVIEEAFRLEAPVALEFSRGAWYLLAGATVPWQQRQGEVEYRVLYAEPDPEDPPDSVNLRRTGVPWSAWIDVGRDW